MNHKNAQLTLDGRGLIPVAVKTLRSTRDFSFDLYLCPSAGPPQLYRERHFPITPVDIEHLLGQGVATLYTRSADAPSYCDHVRTNVLADESISPVERFAILKEATRTVLMNSLASKDVNQMVAVSSNLGRDLVALVSSQKNIMQDLLSTLTHDYSTFTHVTNVCTYCIVLAEAYGIRDKMELMQIAQGGLLHDLGKCFISPKLLNKTTRLSPAEEDEIRSHPVSGFKELCMRPEVSWGQLMMVYQHHERFNGGGYPVGLIGDEIHLWGRLCAVADVYDALTRDRPYRRGVDVKHALEYIGRESGRSFDQELSQCWIATLEKCRK